MSLRTSDNTLFTFFRWLPPSQNLTSTRERILENTRTERRKRECKNETYVFVVSSEDKASVFFRSEAEEEELNADEEYIEEEVSLLEDDEVEEVNEDAVEVSSEVDRDV